MNKQIRKLTERILAMALALVMVMGMLPMSALAVAPSTITSDLGSTPVIVGEETVFTVSTTANEDLGKMVFGYFDFNNGDWSAVDSLQYKESKDGQWYDLPKGTPFGPAETGFPVTDATSTFRVTFNTVGNYSFSVAIKTVEDGTELCAVNQQVEVVVKPSEITTNIEETDFVVGTATEFAVTSIPNGHAGEYVFGKFTFSNWDAVEKLEYWGVMENQWLDLPEDALFGPAETGFPMTQATTRVRVTFKQAGQYDCTIALVKAADKSTVLTSVETKFTVRETIPPVVESAIVTTEGWTDQGVTVEVTVSDQGGSGVQKVVYGTTATYEEAEVKTAQAKDDKYQFTVEENGTYYVWAIDGNGNVSTDAKSVLVDKIDKKRPSLEATPNPESWTNGSVEITVEASDVSGVTVKYSNNQNFDNAIDLTLDEHGMAKFTVSDEFNGNYYIQAQDGAGNINEKIVLVLIDKTKPTILTVTKTPSGWTKENVVIQGKVEDNASGVTEVVFGTDNTYETATEANFDKENGTYTFVVENNGTYNVWAKDTAGNYSEITTIEVDKIDKTLPQVVNISADPAGWTNTNVTISGTVSDEGGSQVDKVVYGTENNFVKAAGEATFDKEKGTYSFVVEKSAEFNGNYFVWAIDGAGNPSNVAKEVTVQIDTTPPATGSFAADKTYSNDNVTISGTVSDEGGSQVAKVVYGTENDFAKAAGEATFDKENGTYSFVVENTKEFDGVYYIWAVDAAGNHTETPAEVELHIDTTKPKVMITYDRNNDSGYYSKNEYPDKAPRTATITVTEAHFEAPEVSVNGKNVTTQGNCIYITAKDAAGEYVEFSPEITWEHDGADHTATIQYTADANYTFEIKVTDKAGNVNSENEINVTGQKNPFAFTVDTVDPEASITVATDNAATETWNTLLEALTFGLYSAERIEVSAEVKDMTSDVQVEYYKVSGKDAETVLTVEDLKTVEWKPWSKDETACIVDTKGVESRLDHKLVYKEYQQFVVYLKVTDQAGNVTYICTDGAILDNKQPETPALAPYIVATPSQQPVNGIYNTDVAVDVTVQENNDDNAVYSGLKNIRYEIYDRSNPEAGPTQAGDLYSFNYVKNDTEHYLEIFDSSLEESDKQSKQEGYTPQKSDLRYSWTMNGAIIVNSAKNNSNDVIVKVFAEDNSGNTNELEIPLKIDVTAPKIDISYNNNTPDSGSYYKADRTATIKITERNFNAEDVKITITNTDGTIPTIPAHISDWKEVVGSGNLDDTTYTATIVYDADGDYTFDISYVDLATNPCAGAVYANDTQNATAFTIDKTAPVVSVAYNNNSAQNEKYFKNYRTATITIVEHNFPVDDIARVVFTQTAERGGEVPTVSWAHDGDTHIATFKYNKDGDYTFDVAMTDLAGNASAEANYGSSVAGKDFIVDTTKNMISQSGVESGVAYGHDAEVIPNIKISDINLQNYTVTLTGVQKDKTIDLTNDVNALLSKGTETVTGIFDIFETKQDLDGIYTLKMTSRDKAGNEDSMEIVFTVNRFGSVYVFEDYLLNLVTEGGAFVQKIDNDLVITEFNADKLVADSLKIEITVDGKPLENVQYTVTPEINDTVSVGSSGWYQYKYTISKDNFAADGVYKISISSEDATGNTPENSNYEDKGMTFRVDSTQSEISSVVGLEKAIINAQEVTVKYTVFDTIGIKSILVYVDGKPVDEITDFTADSNNYSGSFTLAESSSAQAVRIVVEDMAGNITDTNAENFTPAYEFNGSVTVSTNIFVRWYANKPLFWGSIGGVVVVAGALWFFIAGKKKKEEATAK